MGIQFHFRAMRSVVKDLLAAGAEVDKALNNGSTPLISAARRGYEVIVNALLAAWTEVDKASNKGNTPCEII